jgi:transposase
MNEVIPDMPKVKYVVDLNDQEREHLLDVIRHGRSPARKIKRAHILLKADQDHNDAQIAQAVETSIVTVSHTRKRFVEEGLDALNERPRSGQPPKLDGKQQAHIIAVACSSPPQGHTHWALRLLASKVVQLGFAESISPETVRKILKKPTQTLAENPMV